MTAIAPRTVPYVSDPWLPAGLIGADERHVLQDGGIAGALMETFVATELERQASWAAQPLSVWHYRDNGREVDTVVEHPSGDIVGIEVKASASVRHTDFNGLAHVRDRVATRGPYGDLDVVLLPDGIPGGYEQLAANAVREEAYALAIAIAGLDDLIASRYAKAITGLERYTEAARRLAERQRRGGPKRGR